jgi:hypothetical protein
MKHDGEYLTICEKWLAYIFVGDYVLGSFGDKNPSPLHRLAHNFEHKQNASACCKGKSLPNPQWQICWEKGMIQYSKQFYKKVCLCHCRRL